MTVHRHLRSLVIKLKQRGYEADVRAQLVQVGARTITVAGGPAARAPVGSDLVAWWHIEGKRADGEAFTFRDRLGRHLAFDELFPSTLNAKDARFIDFGAWKQAVALMGGRKEAQDGGVAGGTNQDDAGGVEHA